MPIDQYGATHGRGHIKVIINRSVKQNLTGLHVAEIMPLDVRLVADLILGLCLYLSNIHTRFDSCFVLLSLKSRIFQFQVEWTELAQTRQHSAAVRAAAYGQQKDTELWYLKY